MFCCYNASTVLQCHFLNVIMGTGRCVIPGIAMAKHVCSIFTITIDKHSEVNSQVDSLREISKSYSLSDFLYYPCIHPVPL